MYVLLDVTFLIHDLVYNQQCHTMKVCSTYVSFGTLSLWQIHIDPPHTICL